MALPFTVDFPPGTRPANQVISAFKKAALSGRLKSGDRFPSALILSQELRIHPHTAQEVTAILVAEGLLVVEAGHESRVGKIPEMTEEDRSRFLDAEIDRLVLESRALNISLSDLQNATAQRWKSLS